MKKTSLQRTLPFVNEIEPIYLNNYVRSWNALEDKTVTVSTTYLGINKVLDKKTSGVIFEVEHQFLSTLDKREFLYTREKVAFENIEFLANNKLDIQPEDEIWIYITSNPQKPSKKSPIIQSYVDVCISGCMELEEEFNLENFAQNFIQQTTNWSDHWVNDRIFPRAPHIHEPMAYNIDKLLFANVPQHFKNITIE